MPSFNSKVQLSTAAQNTNTVLSDIDRIKGAFKVYTADEMNAAHVNYFTDGQIVYASDSGSLYKASVQLADPGAGIFEDSVSFSEFSFNSGSFNSASFDGGSSTLTLFGESLVGSEQVSSSVDLSSLSGGGSSVEENLQDVLSNGNFASSSIILKNSSSLATGVELRSATGYSAFTGSLQVSNGGILTTKVTGTGASLENVINSTVFERITNSGTEILQALTASNGVAFPNIDLSQNSKFILAFGGSGGDITYMATSSILVPTSSIPNFDTEVSRSVVESGFGSGGGSVSTLQQITDQGNTTDVSMSIMDIEIFSNTVTDLNNSYSGSIYIGSNVVSGSDLTPITSKQHTFIGADAGRNLGTPSYGLTAVGHGAMKGKVGNSGGGSANTAIGANSLFDLDDETKDNTAIGYSSLLNMESGSGNVAVGARVAFNVIQLQDSVVIGSNARPVGDSTNQILIGTNAFGSGSNTVTIGDGNITDNYFSGNLTGSIQDVYIADWGSISASLASLNGGGGSGDITSVVAGDGLSGGADTGDATITLDTSSQHFIDAVNALAGDGGIFTTTGSFKSTTNDLQVTGSFSVGDGLFKLKEFTTLPTVEAGAIAYSASVFYFGVD